MRKIGRLEWVYLFLQSEILLFLLFHDWIPQGSLNDVEAVQSYYARDELIKTTLINSVPFAIAFLLCRIRIGKAYPLWMRLFLIIYFPSLFSVALLAWWIPYFFGATAERVERYQVLFGKTHAFSPEMNGIVPNTISRLPADRDSVDDPLFLRQKSAACESLNRSPQKEVPA